MRALRALVRALRGVPGSDEDRLLTALAASTDSRKEYLEHLRHAVTIAQTGGVDRSTLLVLLHLAAAGVITPGVEDGLRRVGIDPRPVRVAWEGSGQ